MDLLHPYEAGYPLVAFPNYSPTPHSSSPWSRLLHLRFSTFPPIYMLHTAERLGPGTCLSVDTSAEDPLNVYAYAQDTIFFYPTPPHDDRSMALDATW